MKIIIDSREKKPLTLTHEYIDDIVISKLDVGDYRAEYNNGKQSRIIIERKSVADLFGTLTKGYTRFRKEIERSREASLSLVICVEGSYDKVKSGYKHSKRNGSEVNDQLRTIWAKYNVPYHYFNNRKDMAQYVVDTFVWCGKKEIWV